VYPLRLSEKTALLLYIAPSRLVPQPDVFLCRSTDIFRKDCILPTNITHFLNLNMFHFLCIFALIVLHCFYFIIVLACNWLFSCNVNKLIKLNYFLFVKYLLRKSKFGFVFLKTGKYPAVSAPPTFK
jgi:hypothetical protein